MNKRIRRKRAKKFGSTCPKCGCGGVGAMGFVNGPYFFFFCDVCGLKGGG